MDRRKLVKKLKEFKAQIESEYKPSKIILFGSRANGRSHKDSDVDLIVVSKSFEGKKSFKRSPDLRMQWDLDYPVDFLQIYVASDGSSDKTNDIARRYAEKDKRIHLLEFSRTGKSGVLNKAMAYIKSEIIVFSDANTEYMRDALKNLVKHFSDEKVGCVRKAHL